MVFAIPVEQEWHLDGVATLLVVKRDSLLDYRESW